METSEKSQARCGANAVGHPVDQPKPAAFLGKTHLFEAWMPAVSDLV